MGAQKQSAFSFVRGEPFVVLNHPASELPGVWIARRITVTRCAVCLIKAHEPVRTRC